MMKQLSNGFNRYLKQEQFSVNTVESYIRDIRSFLSFLAEENKDVSAIGECTGPYIQMLRDEGRSAATISRHVASIRSFCRYLVEAELVHTDLAEGIEGPKVEKRLPKIIGKQSLELFLSLPATDTQLGLRDRAMLELLCSTGMRASEIAALDTTDVDWQNHVVNCGKPTGRLIPLPAQASKWCHKYLRSVRTDLAEAGESALFVNHHGRRLTRQGFWKIIKRYAKLAGIENLSPHTLRHSVAALMISSGADMVAVQQVLGHADISTTNVYRKVLEEQTEAFGV